MIAFLVAAQLAASQPVTLPYSFIEQCARTMDPACVLDDPTPLDLALIHLAITEGIETVEDDSPNDPWTPFPADRRGDCDDQAATERLALRAFGIPAKAMHYETGRVKEPDGRTLGHIVLVVELNGKSWVLDRKTPDQIYSPDKRPYAWTPVARQVNGQLLWESFGD